jgi:hypothetical protein
MRELTCDPKLETRGESSLSFIENIRSEEIKPILEKYGLSHLEADKWYPAQNWLNVLNDLAQEPDFTSNLVAIGLKLAEKVLIPPQVETFDQLLATFDMAYQMNHRNGEAGQIITEQIEERYFRIKLEDIYPDDMTYGIFYGFARRLLPQGTQFSVKYDEGQLNRDRGGDETILHIRWG